MTELTCRRVTVEELFSLPEYPRWLDEYREEISPESADDRVLEGAYKYLEAQGLFHSICVFVGEKPVGFAHWTLFAQLHFQGNLVANVGSIWVEPDARKLGAGNLLINELWRCAGEDGAKGVYLSARVNSRTAKIFGRITKPVSTIFWKKLEE